VWKVIIKRSDANAARPWLTKTSNYMSSAAPQTANFCGVWLPSDREATEPAGCEGVFSIAAMRSFTALCTFSNEAHVIWRHAIERGPSKISARSREVNDGFSASLRA